MDNYWFLNDKTVSVQFCNIPAGVSKGDFVDFIWIQPNLVLSAFQHVGCQALLQSERDCCDKTNKNNRELGKLMDNCYVSTTKNLFLIDMATFTTHCYRTHVDYYDTRCMDSDSTDKNNTKKER